MSTFYVRVYKPNFNKSYYNSTNLVGDIFDAYVRNRQFFSEMFFFICNKYSVQDAYFVYNNQRIFIQKLSPQFFDNIINWDQFGFNHLQLWFIKDSWLADRQFYYKSTNYQNVDMYFLPTNWHTCDAVFTENSGLTKTIGDSTARLFSLGKTIISLINEAIEPEAYSAVVPQRNTNGTWKNRADNIVFPGGQGIINQFFVWNFYNTAPLGMLDHPYFNQIIIKTIASANVEPTAIVINQAIQAAPFYSAQNCMSVINAFAGTNSSLNLWFRLKTKNSFIVNNMRSLKTLQGCQLRVGVRPAIAGGTNPNVNLDVVLLARRPIIGNEVGILCPKESLLTSVLYGVEINYGLPKKILTYQHLKPGAIDATTGNVISHATARHYELIFNNGKAYGNNYFQYPQTTTEPIEVGQNRQAYLVSSCLNIYYQNVFARPNFISTYWLVGDLAAIDAANAQKEDAFPSLRNQYRFLSRVAFDIATVKNPPTNGLFYADKVILEWTAPNSSQVFDVPFVTDTFIKINPFSTTGDIGSWRSDQGPYGTFSNSMINIVSPKMYDQSKFAPLTQTNQHRFCPYFMNDLGIIQELPNIWARRGALPTNPTKSTIDVDLLTVFDLNLSDRPARPSDISRLYAEFEFGRTWDDVLRKGGALSTAPLFNYRQQPYVANYDQAIVCAAKPMEDGVRIFKEYIDRKLYYRFRHFPKFMIKIPYQLFSDTYLDSADFFCTFIPARPPDTGNGFYQMSRSVNMTEEAFAELQISSCSGNEGYPGNWFSNVIQRTTNFSGPTKIIQFVIGFWEPRLAVTVITLVRAFLVSGGTVIVSLNVGNCHLWATNETITNASINQKNDLNNVTANFDWLAHTQYQVPTAQERLQGPKELYFTSGKFSTRENSEYLWKNDKEFSINTQLNLERMRAAAICLPQLNSPVGINSLVIGSSLFATSRGRLLPSFIENADSRNLINFQQVVSPKSFKFHFNSLISLVGRRTGTFTPTNQDYNPDIYLLFA
jgi:hypothetical protein